MEKAYLLPITSLLTSTKGVHHVIVFQAWLPPERIAREACVVKLSVRDGLMLFCQIRASTGTLLFQQEQAMNVLSELGLLEWQRATAPTGQGEKDDTQRTSVHLSVHQIPIRCTLAGEHPALDHAHRRVLLLVDGARSVHQIAHLLRKSPEEILLILQALQEQHLITW